MRAGARNLKVLAWGEALCAPQEDALRAIFIRHWTQGYWRGLCGSGMTALRVALGTHLDERNRPADLEPGFLCDSPSVFPENHHEAV